MTRRENEKQKRKTKTKNKKKKYRRYKHVSISNGLRVVCIQQSKTRRAIVAGDSTSAPCLSPLHSPRVWSLEQRRMGSPFHGCTELTLILKTTVFVEFAQMNCYHLPNQHVRKCEYLIYNVVFANFTRTSRLSN